MNRKNWFVLLSLMTIALVLSGSRFAVRAADGITENNLLNGKYELVNLAEIDANIGGNSIKFLDKDPTDNLNEGKANYKPISSVFCENTVYKKTSSDKGITLKNGLNDLRANSIDATIDVDYKFDGSCRNFTGALTFNKNGAGELVANGLTASSPDGSSSNDACGENTHGLQLAWLICPAIDAMGGLTDGLVDLFEGQLSFTVSQNLGNADSQTRVRTTWALMKNLASAFLVIIMLLMVFAQAFGGGPMDAYTVKKMLPRLVIAVIAIQISWYIFAWVIDFVNAIGNGIADLLFLPFGGSGNMHLGNLFDNAKVGAEFTGPAGWLGMAAIIGFGIADLPMLLIILLGAVVALVAALVTLMFRKILIIMLLILVPLALLAWILPGTQRYWKMWWDNFIKVLFMFPLVVTLVAAGRIFAYVAGTQDNGDFGGFLNFLMVMVGYFGPLFIIPKTFKWGGQMMQMAGNGINQGLNKISSPGKSYLQGLHQRSRWMLAKQTREGIRMHEARQGFAEGLTAGGARGRINRARLVRPGGPSSEAALVRRAVQNAQIEKAKAWEEERSAAEAELTMVLLPEMVSRGASHDLVREAIGLKKKMVVGKDSSGNDIVFDGKEYADTHHLSQRAALDRMVVHGQWGAIDKYLTDASADPAERAAADGFKNDSKNAPAIGQKLTHQLKGWSVAVNSDEGAIGAMSGHEVESIIAHYTTIVEKGSRPGATVEEQEAARQAASDFSGFLTRFETAKTSDNIHLDVRATNAVDAYYNARRGDTRGIDNINNGDTKVDLARAKGSEDPVELIKREGSREMYGLETIKPV